MFESNGGVAVYDRLLSKLVVDLILLYFVGVLQPLRPFVPLKLLLTHPVR